MKGLEPIWEYESLQDELVWSVIGRKQPRALKKRESRDEYEAKFYALAEKYNKNQNPPMDGEKD